MGSKAPAATTTQTNKVELGPEQTAIANLATPFAQQYASSPLPTLPTNTVAGFTPAEVQGQTGALNAASGVGADLASSASGANQFLNNPAILSPDSNPYLAESGNAITQNLTQNLLEQILPGLRSGASVAGGPYSGGSSREGISTGVAAGRTQQAAGSALSSLYSNAYGQGLDAMGKGLALTPQTQMAQLFGPQTEAAVGGQQRAMNQAQLDATNQQQLLTQMLPLLRAQDLYSLISGMPGGSGVSTVTGAQPGTNKAMTALGGAASGASLGSMIFPGFGTAAGAGLGALLGFL